MSSITTADAAQAYGRALLVGEQIRLRPLRDDDLPVLEAWWEDPEWQPLQRFSVRPQPNGSNLAMIREWTANKDASGAGYCIESLESGELVGQITLWGIQLPERAARLAIQIGPDFVAQGFGTDAVRTMTRFGFLAMGVNRIQLETFAYNDRARRAYARAGFVEEGVRREAVWIDGGFADEVVMSILRSEWRP